MYMCSKNNGSLAKQRCIHEEEVTDQDVYDLSTQIVTAFGYILDQAEEVGKDVYDKMMAHNSQDLIDEITEMIEDRR